MKDNTRLMIYLKLDEHNAKGWGYDAPYFTTGAQLKQSIQDDFAKWPKNIGVVLNYDNDAKDIDVTNGDDLATQAVGWLLMKGARL